MIKTHMHIQSRALFVFLMLAIFSFISAWINKISFNTYNCNSLAFSLVVYTSILYV